MAGWSLGQLALQDALRHVGYLDKRHGGIEIAGQGVRQVCGQRLLLSQWRAAVNFGDMVRFYGIAKYPGAKTFWTLVFITPEHHGVLPDGCPVADCGSRCVLCLFEHGCTLARWRWLCGWRSSPSDRCHIVIRRVQAQRIHPIAGQAKPILNLWPHPTSGSNDEVPCSALLPILIFMLFVGFPPPFAPPRATKPAQEIAPADDEHKR
jgi:hypothetical protein